MGNEKDDLSIIKELLILGLLKSGVSHEAIGGVLGVSAKRVQNAYPMRKVSVD